MEGILGLWSGYITLTNWKKRYCVLEENVLNICHSQSKEIDARVHMRVATIDSKDNKLYFAILTGNKKYTLRAENYALKERWLEAL